MMRLDKYLTVCSIGSRSEVRKLVKEGRVTVNGVPAGKPEQKVDEKADAVCLDGKPLFYEQYRYYLFYKPAGCVTANSDKTHKTVMDYFPEKERKSLCPVGRLDRDTEGLLLVTNDGAFNHHLMSPSHHVAKCYYAQLDAPVPESAVEDFASGILIGDDKETLPATLERLESTEDGEGKPVYRAKLTITEGRYHQVKRMFQAVGCHVTYLKRISLGNLTLGGLQPGEYRRLTEQELALLRKN